MNALTFKTNACMICHEKNIHHQLDKLNIIKREIDNYQVKAKLNHNIIFNWFISSRCHFGIPCHHLESNDNYAKNLAKELEPYIVSVCENNNESLYYRIYNLMRGDFSQICYQMEKLHRKYLDDKKKDEV